ncbi:hypothetical protein UY3_05521 [Chelonia mydas]|uniref:Uncharacterized protein n=1 Tax=Chelonia mydas TaxID=8469 RepID=M7BJB8_CHEMY|nr:hypothetical protein UY3_05521 [Chelonia mydas]
MYWKIKRFYYPPNPSQEKGPTGVATDNMESTGNFTRPAKSIPHCINHSSINPRELKLLSVLGKALIKCHIPNSRKNGTGHQGIEERGSQEGGLEDRNHQSQWVAAVFYMAEDR